MGHHRNGRWQLIAHYPSVRVLMHRNIVIVLALLLQSIHVLRLLLMGLRRRRVECGLTRNGR